MSESIISHTDHNFGKTMRSIVNQAVGLNVPVHFEFEDKGNMVIMTHAQLKYLLSDGNRPGVLLPDLKGSKN